MQWRKFCLTASLCTHVYAKLDTNRSPKRCWVFSTPRKIRVCHPLWVVRQRQIGTEFEPAWFLRAREFLQLPISWVRQDFVGPSMANSKLTSYLLLIGLVYDELSRLVPVARPPLFLILATFQWNRHGMSSSHFELLLALPMHLGFFTCLARYKCSCCVTRVSHFTLLATEHSIDRHLVGCKLHSYTFQGVWRALLWFTLFNVRWIPVHHTFN